MGNKENTYVKINIAMKTEIDGGKFFTWRIFGYTIMLLNRTIDNKSHNTCLTIMNGNCKWKRQMNIYFNKIDKS